MIAYQQATSNMCQPFELQSCFAANFYKLREREDTASFRGW